MTEPLPIHDAAKIFPMEDETIQELADDIGKHGLLVPIELCDGKVIDGRRRLAACTIAGVEPEFVDINADDPVAYVLSLNLHRRHLNSSQRSMVGARAKDVRQRLEDASKTRMLSGKGADGSGGRGHKKNPMAVGPQGFQQGKSRDEVGKTVGVGGRQIDYATKVLESGTPELIKAVDEGLISVRPAAVIAEKPKEVQRETVAAVKSGEHKPSQKAPLPNVKPEGELQGKGVILANEAINCLTRIPKNDPLRQRGMQIVADWIRRNK